MAFENLKVPKRAFTKQERAWLENVLIPAIKTALGIEGRNVTLSNNASGQVVNAKDCPPCS